MSSYLIVVNFHDANATCTEEEWEEYRYFGPFGSKLAASQYISRLKNKFKDNMEPIKDVEIIPFSTIYDVEELVTNMEMRVS